VTSSWFFIRQLTTSKFTNTKNCRVKILYNGALISLQSWCFCRSIWTTTWDVSL